jgi:hypothetical protein
LAVGRPSGDPSTIFGTPQFVSALFMTRRNPNHLSARYDGAWDTHRRHETKANWIYFRREPPSIGNRDTTVPVTQCNRPCHVTLSHTYSSNTKTAPPHRALQTRSKHPLNTLIDRICTHLACTRLHLDHPRPHTPCLHTSTLIDRICTHLELAHVYLDRPHLHTP